jgi:hypothetical protein
MTLITALIGPAVWSRGGGWFLILGPVTLPPGAYPTRSEKYYLACVDQSTPGVAGLAALRLLRRTGNVEIELTRKVRARKSDVIGDILLMVLFKEEPERYLGDVERLSRTSYRNAFGWVKTDEMFEGEYCDFYFDGPGEAALALLDQGHLSINSLGILLQFSRSYYAEDRGRAAAVFRKFEGIPSYDPSPEPKNGEMPALTREQTDAIERWFSTNQKRLTWEAGAGRYRLTLNP